MSLYEEILECTARPPHARGDTRLPRAHGPSHSLLHTHAHTPHTGTHFLRLPVPLFHKRGCWPGHSARACWPWLTRHLMWPL